jgi:hypothetical protein
MDRKHLQYTERDLFIDGAIFVAVTVGFVSVVVALWSA